MPYDTSWITADIRSPHSTDVAMPAHALPTRLLTQQESASMRLWSVIPARKGSVGVPAKNIRPLGAKSLLDRAISCADDLGGEIVISTDYEQSDYHAPKRALVLTRPPRLATHDASMWDVLADLGQKLGWKRQDTVVLLQPTSLHPDRPGIVRTILKEHHRPAVTVERFPERWHPWYAISPDCYNHPPKTRQGLPVRFRANGLAYVMSGCTARRGSFWQDCPKFYEVSDVINVDTLADWCQAVSIYG